MESDPARPGPRPARRREVRGADADRLVASAARRRPAAVARAPRRTSGEHARYEACGSRDSEGTAFVPLPTACGTTGRGARRTEPRTCGFCGARRRSDGLPALSGRVRAGDRRSRGGLARPAARRAPDRRPPGLPSPFAEQASADANSGVPSGRSSRRRHAGQDRSELRR